MLTAWVRVYEELNQFLASQKRKTLFAQDLPDGSTVLRLLDVLGIPASNVDLVLADGVSVGFAHEIRDGERVSLYPVFETLDIGGLTRLRSEPLRNPHFIADRSLERLSVSLNLLGFDVTLIENLAGNPSSLRKAEAEQRILIACEGGNTPRSDMSRILLLKETRTGEQVREVLSRLDLVRSVVRYCWDVTPHEAETMQRRIRPQVVTRDEIGQVKLIGGVDVAYDEKSRIATAAVAVLSYPDLELCAAAQGTAPLKFPYLPGLLSFREIPAVLDAVFKLRKLPDLLLCDGHGIAHPRRFGLACHVGLLTGIATIGIAKSLLVGSHEELPPHQGSWVPLIDAGETIGAVIRTRERTKPVYVSVGSGISLKTAVAIVVRASRYRLPEPARWADRLSRQWRNGSSQISP
jgi:deoxyribonuclease V